MLQGVLLLYADISIRQPIHPAPEAWKTTSHVQSVIIQCMDNHRLNQQCHSSCTHRPGSSNMPDITAAQGTQYKHRLSNSRLQTDMLANAFDTSEQRSLATALLNVATARPTLDNARQDALGGVQ